MKVYFDNAATTALDPEVLEAMMPYMTDHYGNPSSIHSFGRFTRAAIEKSRKKVAELLNASTGEIFFTSGGTESNNMILKCAVKDLGVQRIISSPIEHHCVLHTVEDLAAAGVETDYVALDEYGQVDYENLESLLREDKGKTLVSLMYANNEIGNVLDAERVAALCKEYGALFHSDTVQAIAHFPIDVQTAGIDFLSGSAHKFHGPKGIGFAFVRSGLMMKPFIHGGAQERNMRAGTENLYGIVGLGKAMELAISGMEEHAARIRDVREYMKASLIQKMPGVAFNGVQEGDFLFTVLNVSFPPSPKSSMLLFNLDIAGIAASGGSACSSGSDIGSHVMQALDAPEERSNVRFSFSKFSTREEVDYVVEKLLEIFGVKVTDPV